MNCVRILTRWTHSAGVRIGCHGSSDDVAATGTDELAKPVSLGFRGLKFKRGGVRSISRHAPPPPTLCRHKAIASEAHASAVRATFSLGHLSRSQERRSVRNGKPPWTPPTGAPCSPSGWECLGTHTGAWFSVSGGDLPQAFHLVKPDDYSVPTRDRGDAIG
jgi:hypothetical protein